MRKLSAEETEEKSMLISINDGIKSGLLDDEEKSAYISNLRAI
ncbi:MAG: hypothetical protein PHF97_00870 [Bacteroidales bacterium]|nr:hypothetical protein [Bacteroidales bacterium]